VTPAQCWKVKEVG